MRRKKERKVVSSKSSVPAKSVIRWRRATSDYHHHHHRHQLQPDCHLKWSILDGHLAKFQPEEVMDLEENERKCEDSDQIELRNLCFEALPPGVLRTLRTGHAGPESNRKNSAVFFVSLALIHRKDLALNDCSLVSISLIWAIIIFITAIRRVFLSW